MISKTIVIAWTLFLLYTFFAGAAEVTQGDASDTVTGFALMFSMIVHFLLWCAVAVPTFVISRMFRRSRASHAAPGGA